jgi:hypothetical protein
MHKWALAAVDGNGPAAHTDGNAVCFTGHVPSSERAAAYMSSISFVSWSSTPCEATCCAAGATGATLSHDKQAPMEFVGQ